MRVGGARSNRSARRLLPRPGFCGRGLLTPTAAWIEAGGQQRPCRGQGRSHRNRAGAQGLPPELWQWFCGRGLLTPTATWSEACGQQRPCRGQGRSYKGRSHAEHARSAAGAGLVGGGLRPRLRWAAFPTIAPTKKAARRPPLRTHSHCCGGGEPSIALVRLRARAVTNTSCASVPRTAQGAQRGATGDRRAVQLPGACRCVVHASVAGELRFTPR